MSEDSKTKIFVPHLNVITSGGNITVHAFEEHDLVVPVEYLNMLKSVSKTATQEGDCAHSFLKEIGELIESTSFSKKHGIDLMDGGKFRIYEKRKTQGGAPETPSSNLEEILISTAQKIKKENPDRPVIIVVNDSDEKAILNYRLKGSGIRIEKARFNTLKPEILDQGFVKLEVEPGLIEKMHKKELIEDDLEKLYEYSLRPNQFFHFVFDCEKGNRGEDFGIVKSDKEGKLFIEAFDMKRALRREILRDTKDIRAKEGNYQQAALINLLLDPDIQLVVAAGGVGTGKTFLSYACSLSQTLEETYTRMILSKPEVSVFQDIGYLPGTESQKTIPWLASFSTNHQQLGQHKHKNHGPMQDFDQFLEKKVIEAKSLSFIQGASYSNTIYLIDEFQNLSPHQARAILSRAAEGSKFVITGDLQQVTNRRTNKNEPFLTSKHNGLLAAVHYFSFLEKSPHVGFVKLDVAYRNEISNLALGWELKGN